MRKTLIAYLLLILVWQTVFAQLDVYTGPIIDMHLHSYDVLNPHPNPATGASSAAKNAEEHMHLCFDLMKKNRIVLAVVSGTQRSVERWAEYKPQSVLRGFEHGNPESFGDTIAFLRLIQQKKIQVLAEIPAQYDGYSASDPAFDPYWRIAERYGTPVGIHTGAAMPGMYKHYPKFRLRLGDPMLLEDMLVKFPKLKVYMMHASGYYEKETLHMMYMYENLYVDIAAKTWLPGTDSALESFLKKAKEKGFLDRIMFGTDQMVWPEAIELAVRRINSLDFLSMEDKKGLFYDNAARFLGLSEEIRIAHLK